MTIRTWVTATILIASLVTVVFVCTPFLYSLLNTLSTTVTSSNVDVQSRITQTLSVISLQWPWIVVICVCSILIWAYIRPQHKEVESYVD